MVSDVFSGSSYFLFIMSMVVDIVLLLKWSGPACEMFELDLSTLLWEYVLVPCDLLYNQRHSTQLVLWNVFAEAIPSLIKEIIKNKIIVDLIIEDTLNNFC